MELQWTRWMSIGFLILFIACDELNAASTNRLFAAPETVERKCGYEGCPVPKSDMLNVHIVAHTHDDVGWLKTVDQYYYGTKQFYQKANVQLILDSVIASLLKDPKKRFIYVESSYFFKWWHDQSDTYKELVKQLVNEGRLEFIGGAWSMNDEAATHYQSTVDQFTWGLRKLNDTFGACARPKIGWQIDPFGHSKEFASMLAQMGYDGLFLGRIDHEDKDNRFINRSTEMIWKASDSLGSSSNLFTSILYDGYSSPRGFCFDVLCSEEPVVDDKSSPEYNVEKKANDFLNHFNNVKTKYRTNNILITLGGDFTYQSAEMQFHSIDRLISHINGRQRDGLKVNVFYSTPSCYLKAVHDAKISLDTKRDDFFPYASDSSSFWTGYFTSRPSLKRFERIGNHYLQTCKQLSTLAPKKASDFDENLDNLREVMGIMQHHDAVTGTEKQHVAEDYARLLQIGVDKCSKNVNNALNQFSAKHENSEDAQLMPDLNSKYAFDYVNCADLNISSCEITETSTRFMVTLYNPLSHSTSQYVRVPVSDGSTYEIFDSENALKNSQLVSIPMDIQSLSYRRSTAKVELVFLANDLPPLGFKSYFVQRKLNLKLNTLSPTVQPNENSDYVDENDDEELIEPFTIGNEYLNLTFDEKGLLKSAANQNVQMNVRQNFYKYETPPRSGGRQSGAYIFRPRTGALEIAAGAKVRVIRGDLVDEVHQTFSKWVSQVVRVYKKEKKAEFQWMVGPIPVDDRTGREIITRFDTDITSNGIFYTDSNGREWLRRERNQRPTWEPKLQEKIAGNYYPVTAGIAIRDENRRFVLLTDRAQGGSSLADGSLELMVHRRLLHDDGFGVGEALDEEAYGKGLIARGSTYFVFGSRTPTQKSKTEAIERLVAMKTLLPIWPLFSDVSQMSYDKWKNNYNHIFSGLKTDLPKNVHLLTLEPWKQDSILVRFEHIFAKDEHEKYSHPVSFDFKDIFSGIDVVSMRETTLSANQWLNEVNRLQFKAKTEIDSNEVQETTTEFSETTENSEVNEIEDVTSSEIDDEAYDSTDFMITLNPMEIRTFVVKLKPKSLVNLALNILE